MPLSLNEIKDRALAFSREWEGARAERAEAQTFWNEFFAVFGISRRRVATFEEPVKTLPLFDKHPVKGGRIDLFWRGMLIAEHKSRGRGLDSAYKQALDYFGGLPMAWVSHVCGRLESRYRYSKDIVYNNFPWPEIPQSPAFVGAPLAGARISEKDRADTRPAPTEKLVAAIEQAAQEKE